MAIKRSGIVVIGMECSGALRRRFQAAGFETYSIDRKPAEDAGGEEMAFSDDHLPLGRHLVGDVFAALDNLRANDLWPVLAIFHPDCTYLTNSAAWAFTDGPYHQRVKPGTLVGAARRQARVEAIETVRRLMELDIERSAIENPPGAISTHIRPADQIFQPYMFGDDASKATGLWLNNLPPLAVLPGELWAKPRIVNGMERWSNQTDSGQNRLSPGANRATNRARTYPGPADAIVAQWGSLLSY